MFSPAMIYGAIGAVIASFLIGFGSGWKFENGRFMDYKKEVAVVAAKKEAENISIQKQSDLVTKGIKNEYEARLSAIRSYYSSGLRNSSSGAMSTIPNSTFSIDGKTSNLPLDCAYTTQQLISLQDWIKEQAVIK